MDIDRICEGSRRYRHEVGRYYWLMIESCDRPHHYCSLVSQTDCEVVFDVRHMLVPAEDGRGLDELEKSLAVTLPADFRAFYSRWRSGWLFWRREYRLLPAEEIVSLTADLRRQREEPAMPVRIVRFCELEDGNYMALRYEAEGRCRVMYADIGCTDQELQSPEGDRYVRDESFTAWLERLERTDGFPIAPGAEAVDKNYVERVR